MAKGRGDNYISIWGWMFILFLTALPCIGIIVVILGAFVGDNESRKNYFRAILVWALLLFVVWIGLAALGLIPALTQAIHQWLQQQQHQPQKPGMI